MALDDRDRNLDKALARHFRASADALSVAAGSSASQLSTCPDAEILAAYHDSSLSPEELALWKPHVLGCGDCQLVLEHLGTPLDAPAALSADRPTLAADQVGQRPGLFSAPPASSASSAATTPAGQAAPAPVSITRLGKGHFRWLVPTGAIAAGLLTWLVIHESQPLKLAPNAESARVQTAENRPLAQPLPSPSAPSSSATSELRRVSPSPNVADQQLSAPVDQLKQDLAQRKKEKDLEQPDSALVGGAAGNAAEQTRHAEQTLNGRLQSVEQAPPLYAARASHGPRITQQQQQAQLLPQAIGGNDRAALDKKTAPPALVEPVPPREDSSFVEPGSVAPQPSAKVAAAAPAPPPPPPAPAPSTAAAAGVPASAAPRSGSAAKASPSADAVGAVTESVEVQTAAPSTNMLRVASASVRGPDFFSDPAHKFFWRVGPAGSLEFSADNGATWSPQSSGVSDDLFTGSAPAAKVCWVVGANGIILRTTDAGKHWVKLSSPVAVDILGIHATDAFHASIWLLPDPKSTAVQTYKTSDGALNWSLIPNN